MSLPAVTVQCAFASKPGASNPAWQDISGYLIDFDTRHGRTYETDQVSAGSLTVTLDNADRSFDPTYSAGQFYPNVLPRKRIRVTCVWNSVTSYLFDGYVDRWPPVWTGPDDATVTVTARDAFLPLATANIAGSFPQELSGARIQRVLAAALWPASSTPTAGYWVLGTGALGTTDKLAYTTPTSVLDTGSWLIQPTVIVDTDNVDALSHIQQVTDTEQGLFFVDGQGRLVFHDRFRRIRTQTPAVTLTDDPAAADSTHIVYFALSPSFDYDHGANDVKVTATGGTTQTATSSTAVDDYFRTTETLSTLHDNDPDAMSAARFRLHNAKDVRDGTGKPRIRVDSVSINPWAPVGTEAWPAVLARELSDRVNVRRLPGVHPAGVVEEINQDCYIEAIRHTATPPNDWVTVYELSPASPAADFWVLGSSALAISNTLV